MKQNLLKRSHSQQNPVEQLSETVAQQRKQLERKVSQVQMPDLQHMWEQSELRKRISRWSAGRRSTTLRFSRLVWLASLVMAMVWKNQHQPTAQQASAQPVSTRNLNGLDGD